MVTHKRHDTPNRDALGVLLYCLSWTQVTQQRNTPGRAMFYAKHSLPRCRSSLDLVRSATSTSGDTDEPLSAVQSGTIVHSAAVSGAR